MEDRNTHTSHELSATVVVDVLILTCVAYAVVFDESGCPVCFAQVYDADSPYIVWDAVVVATILFAPVAGLTR